MFYPLLAKAYPKVVTKKTTSAFPGISKTPFAERQPYEGFSLSPYCYPWPRIYMQPPQLNR